MRTKRRGVPNLGERIASFMEAASLNASELAARTGISVSYLTRIIRGEVVNPTIDFVSRIASGLGVTETELVREDVEELEQVDIEDEEGHEQLKAGKEPPRTVQPATTSGTTRRATGVRSSPVSMRRGQQPLRPPTLGEYVDRIMAKLSPADKDLASKLVTTLLDTLDTRDTQEDSHEKGSGGVAAPHM